MTPRRGLASRPARALVAGVLTALAASMARAGDGVIEIGQVCASGGGCLPGDLPGFPVEVGAPGSYRLVSDLDVPDLAVRTDGIRIAASYVTLDLGGYEIRGKGTCAAVPPVCLPASADGDGVSVDAAAEGVEIRNGSVSGFRFGVGAAGRNFSAVALRASANVASGVQVFVAASGSRLARCSATRNGGSGIHFDESAGGALVSDCSADDNGGVGIAGPVGGLLAETTARANATSGIAPRALVVGATASGNTLDGFLVSKASLVVDAAAYGNGRIGVDALLLAAMAVNRSIVRGNGAQGIAFSGVGAYRDDVITGNATAPVSGGSERAGNHCAGAGTLSATCP